MKWWNETKPFLSRDRSTSPYRGRSRSEPQDGDDRSRTKRYDRSPTIKKPRVASKPINKDKDWCYNCHEKGHFVNQCPLKQKHLVADVMEAYHTMMHPQVSSHNIQQAGDLAWFPEHKEPAQVPTYSFAGTQAHLNG